MLVARDGDEGFELARSERPDIVVSDIMMPKRNGLELVTALKADRTTADIPILLLSAKAQSADVRRGLTAGADDYVTKPFEPLDLVDRVNRLIELRSPRRSGRPPVIRDDLGCAPSATAVEAVGLDAPDEIHLERPARARARRLVDQRRPGHGQARRPQPAELAAEQLAEQPRRRRHRPRRAGRGRRSRVRQLPPARRRGCTTCCARSSPTARRGYARPDIGQRRGGQRRVRLGQPDRPAPRRRRPLGRVRRRAVPPPRALRVTRCTGSTT